MGNEGTVVVIGAGPAGLTAARELLKRSAYHVVVLEASGETGGISRTVRWQGNRIDLGGHRFFTKSGRVQAIWADTLPDAEGCGDTRDDVMLLRERKSRICYGRKFYDYPVTLSVNTLGNLGLGRAFGIGVSYMKAAAFPRKPENSLEDFYVNRFGKALYDTFFRDYTQKVWGVPCSQIPPDWGTQRVKGLSIARTVLHAAGKLIRRDGSGGETSLIEQFRYPRYGVGQMWEAMAADVRKMGGEIRYHRKAVGIELEGPRVAAVVAEHEDGSRERIPCRAVISSMPVRDLISSMRPQAPADVGAAASSLRYRSYITVGLELRRLLGCPPGSGVSDNWIYIQEPDMKMGRLQVFNNWSPGMAGDPTLWVVGTEYFADEGDALWQSPDAALVALASAELQKMGFAGPGDTVRGVVVRVPDAYPAYFGGYEYFPAIRQWLDGIDNLYLVGRNGMHRYNNMDHSMLSAATAVDVLLGKGRKEEIWNVNTQSDYHEEK